MWTRPTDILLIDGLAPGSRLFLHALYAVPLHVAGRYEHGLERSEPEVVVRLRAQLLQAQPAGERGNNSY